MARSDCLADGHLFEDLRVIMDMSCIPTDITVGPDALRIAQVRVLVSFAHTRMAAKRIGNQRDLVPFFPNVTFRRTLTGSPTTPQAFPTVWRRDTADEISVFHNRPNQLNAPRLRQAEPSCERAAVVARGPR